MWFCDVTKTDKRLFLYKITAHKTPYFNEFNLYE